MHKNMSRQLLETYCVDCKDTNNGSLETPLPPARRAYGSESGDPKAAPWEQWETLERKNELAQLNSASCTRPNSNPVVFDIAYYSREKPRGEG